MWREDCSALGYFSFIKRVSNDMHGNQLKVMMIYFENICKHIQPRVIILQIILFWHCHVYSMAQIIFPFFNTELRYIWNGKKWIYFYYYGKFLSTTVVAHKNSKFHLRVKAFLCNLSTKLKKLIREANY